MHKQNNPSPEFSPTTDRLTVTWHTVSHQNRRTILTTSRLLALRLTREYPKQSKDLAINKISQTW